MPDSRIVIAIDGPAGAGKSTVAKLLAKRLGLHYLDTGAMYRVVALAAKRAGLTAEDGEQAAEIARSIRIEFQEPERILLNGEDVTEAIRMPEIGELASALSAHTPIRRVLAEQQRAIVLRGGVTLEGRDTTTVTAPDATLKVFLTASLEERARRRHLEYGSKGVKIEANDLRRQMMDRDHRDTTRIDSPLEIATDAVVVETCGMTPDEVVEKIVSLLPEKGP